MIKKVIALSLVVSIFFTSCAQKELMSKNRYKDLVNNFLITQDSKKLVVIGQKHHYIFDIDKNLKSILSSSRKKGIEARFSIFEVNRDDVIKGGYFLEYKVQRYFSKKERLKYYEDTKWLKESGFKKQKEQKIPDKEVYKYTSKLVGERYIASNIKIPKNSFNKEYAITIEEIDKYKYDKYTRKRLSPVAYTADGALFIGGVVLVGALIISTQGAALRILDGVNFGGDNYYKEDKNTKNNK